jgi:hypothetical protein
MTRDELVKELMEFPPDYEIELHMRADDCSMVGWAGSVEPGDGYIIIFDKDSDDE